MTKIGNTLLCKGTFSELDLPFVLLQERKCYRQVLHMVMKGSTLDKDIVKENQGEFP
jgi:hypothetical protein